MSIFTDLRDQAIRKGGGNVIDSVGGFVFGDGWNDPAAPEPEFATDKLYMPTGFGEQNSRYPERDRPVDYYNGSDNSAGFKFDAKGIMMLGAGGLVLLVALKAAKVI